MKLMETKGKLAPKHGISISCTRYKPVTESNKHLLVRSIQNVALDYKNRASMSIVDTNKDRLIICRNTKRKDLRIIL